MKSFTFQGRFLLNLGVSFQLDWLAGKPPKNLSASPASSTLRFQTHATEPGFSESWDPTQVLMLAKKMFHPLSHLPSPSKQNREFLCYFWRVLNKTGAHLGELILRDLFLGSINRILWQIRAFNYNSLIGNTDVFPEYYYVHKSITT